MELTERRPDGAVVLVVAGDVDVETAPVLQRRVAELAAGALVILDLAAVEFFDSSGLRALDEARDDAARRDGRLVLTGVGPRIVRLLQISGLDGAFSISPTVDDALAGLSHGT